MKRQGHNGMPRDARDESVAVIEEEIRRNRAEMDMTLEELSRRLEPRHIADNLWDTVRDKIPTGSDAAHKFQDLGSNIGRRIGAHPIPSAIIGAGLLWLLAEEARGEKTRMSDIARGLKEGARVAGQSMRKVGEAAMEQARQRRHRSTTTGPYGPGSYYEGGSSDEGTGGIGARAGERMSEARHRVSEVGHRAQERLSEVGERVKDSAMHARERLGHTGERISGAVSHTGDRVRDIASHAGDTLNRTYEDYPLAVGLAALGAGLLAGVAVPNTRRENEAIGPAAQRMRRQIMHAAEGKVGQALDVAEEKVEQMAGKAEEKLQSGMPRKESSENKGSSPSWGSTAQPGKEAPTIPPSPPTVP